MTGMARLVTAMRAPDSVAGLDGPGWSALLSVARAEALLGTLAHRLAAVPVPGAVAPLLDAARRAADQAQVQALWEAQMCRRALAPLGIVPVLLKGTAYAAGGLAPSPGRQIGDLDILVPRARLDAVETALLGAGWEWVKDDPYDQSYYRQWMHELPPLIHQSRDRMIDVHHTILPLTARPTPDAAALLDDAVECGDGLAMLAPVDMVCHAAAHCVADGDFAGGLRNLWDIDRLLRQFSTAHDGFWPALAARARHHQLWPAVHRSARLAQRLFATPLPPDWVVRDNFDSLIVARILARDDWGRETRKGLRLAFYIRSHLIRMPALMLARHLWIKWRRSA